jgi:hypothetical protein
MKRSRRSSTRPPIAIATDHDLTPKLFPHTGAFNNTIR